LILLTISCVNPLDILNWSLSVSGSRSGAMGPNTPASQFAGHDWTGPLHTAVHSLQVLGFG